MADVWIKGGGNKGHGQTESAENLTGIVIIVKEDVEVLFEDMGPPSTNGSCITD